MQNKMLQNDLKRNKLVTLTLVLFIACASLLASLAAALAVNLSDAINALMARAETPHFLQMHSGDIDMEQLSAFASNNSDVDKFQVLRFLNLEMCIRDRSREACGGYWDRLAALVETKASVN